jgi:phage terminase small subunit
MQALHSDRHRAFVLALFQVRPGHGANVKAAKMAGFGTPTSSAKSWSVIASRLAHDERVQAAIQEEAQKYLRAGGPEAVLALRNLIRRPKHKDHARAVAIILDRVDPVETTHTVKVDHQHRLGTVATAKILARIVELATKAGLDHTRLPPMIDVTPVKEAQSQ